MSREEKAEEAAQQAERMATKFNWFGATKAQNQEDAAELYAKAGTQFKISKNFQRAGECYERAADCSLAAGSELDAMGAFKDAASNYAHVDADSAARCYRQAIEFYLLGDRFQAAAKLHENLAQVYDEDGRIEEAIAEYEESANLFETEHDESGANKRRLIVAHLAAKVGQYGRSVEIFERVARHSMENNLLRWSVKTYLFKAVLCSICLNAESKPGEIAATLDRYKGMTDLFASSRECTFCDRIVQAILNTDEDAYRQAYQEYSQISPVPDWETELLHKGQQFIRTKQYAAPDLGGGDDDNPFGTEASNAPATTTAAIASGEVPNPFDAPDVGDDAPDL